jgi:hypothetical protein
LSREERCLGVRGGVNKVAINLARFPFAQRHRKEEERAEYVE